MARQWLSGEDLTFWWADSPAQPTTMAMLMLLDRPPDSGRLRAAFGRAVEAVPRLRQHVVEAPLDITLPHWADDPTFEMDYHVRHHGVTGAHDLDELFREVTVAYETPFDRSRPLWEARIYDGLPDGQAALFFKLHHAVADGVGGNAIFAALTDWERDATEGLPADPPRLPANGAGPWPEPPSLGRQVLEAVRDRVALDLNRARRAARAIADSVVHPAQLPGMLATMRSLREHLAMRGQTGITQFGRARQLAGLSLPFDGVAEVKRATGAKMIDVILTIMARAMGKWYAARALDDVHELVTLVPVNLRTPEQWVEKVHVGNVATGLLVQLPITIADPLATLRAVRRNVEHRKADPAANATPLLAELLGTLGHRFVSWMSAATFGIVDFIVTNVPGILATRYLAGAEIVSAYPFAPVAYRSPASIALYGYRDRLFIGIDADATVMTDLPAFRGMIEASFEELHRAAVPRA